ncbi:MAG TPA: M24 family metallopeptidase [Xanthobacteraceae bacterium]|nr:M24 family metallopeptidase [Xanthobacteraceae bacterium]
MAGVEAMNERVTVNKNARLAAATKYLRDEGLDGLIAASNGLNNFLESNAVYVFSGVRPIGESALVLDRDGRSTLIVTPGWDGERAAALSSADETIATEDLVSTLAGAVKKRRLNVERTVSVGLSFLGQGLVERIGTSFGALPKPADELARDIARLRSAEELAAAERATWIAERGYERLLEFARPGLREYELAAELYCFTKKLGAEDNFLLMSASQHNLAVRAAGERILDVGDIILSEITPCYRGQFAQICRTTVIGEAGPVLREKFAILQDAMAEGLVAGRAGSTVADVTRAINRVIQKAGYGEYCRPPYMRVRGHGLGITSDRPGDIVDTNERVLESGMVFVMHPNQYLPESGYLMCGEPVVVTDHGCRALSARPAELDVIPV